jgi:hypothetical protein
MYRQKERGNALTKINAKIMLRYNFSLKGITAK